MFVHLGSLLKHRNFAHNLQSCSVCKENFPTFEELKLHAKKVHSSQGVHEHRCEHCGRIYRQKIDLRRHVANKHEMMGVMCQVCGKSYSSEKYLKTHFRSVHAQEMNLERFPCEQCGKTFGAKTGLITHTKIKHSDSFAFVCSTCGKGLISKVSFETHMRKHANDPVATCEKCGKEFFTMRRYTQHLENHPSLEEFRYKCSNCPRRFKLDRSCKEHENMHRDDVNQFICDVCSKRFVNVRALRKHMKTFHPDYPIGKSKSGAAKRKKKTEAGTSSAPNSTSPSNSNFSMISSADSREALNSEVGNARFPWNHEIFASPHSSTTTGVIIPPYYRPQHHGETYVPSAPWAWGSQGFQ